MMSPSSSSSSLSIIIGTILLGSTIAKAALVEHYWNISYANANPDGLQERVVIGVNGTWPPPPINVNQDDTLRVHVHNGLGESTFSLGEAIGTSLHSHGNFFNGTNYYDGAVGVTQCAIPSGEDFTYEIPTDLQEGTYWIHGHYNGQYVDGLRAPVTIHPRESRSDNLTWDEDYTIILSDWYHESDPYLVKSYFLNWINPTGAEPVPKSAVIYAANNGSYFNTQSEISNGTGVSNGVGNECILPFEAGKKYRIRLINMSALAMFHIMLGGHTMKVIELDGIEVSPYELTHLPIAVAQRYSVYVEALNTSDTNYAFMACQDGDMYDAIPDDLVMNNTITLSYSSTNPAPAQFNYTEDTWPELNDVVFTPLAVKASAPADMEIELVVAFDTFDDGTNRASFNDITYSMPMVPSLITQMTMGADANISRVYGAMTNAYILPHLANIQLTIKNTDTGKHPFHLHGHEFQVISRSFDYTSNDTSVNPPIVEGQANPSRRDTVVAPPGGNVVIRFRADNPGAWIMHCHIDWHMTSGLATIMITDPDWTQSELTIPDVVTQQCAAQGIATSGNVVGLQSTSDFKGEPYGPWPLVMGWTPKAIGALAGCILSAILGFATIIWYGWGELEQGEIEQEIQRKNEIMAAKGGKYGFIKKLAGKKN